jgi:outer membrane protein assembly factor BamB
MRKSIVRVAVCVVVLLGLSACGGGGGGGDANSSRVTLINSTIPDFINNGASTATTTSVTLSLSASDSVGVTGYFASETSTTPSAAAPGWIAIPSVTQYWGFIPFTLSTGDGTKTVYVWFKNAAGIVSASKSATIDLQQKVKWVYSTGSGGAIYYSSPAIGDDGTIYVANGAPFMGDETRGLHAVNPDGTLKWIYAEAGAIGGTKNMFSSPALGPAGIIYVQGHDSSLYAVNPDGTLKWKTANPSVDRAVGVPTPSVGSDGTIYIGAETVYAFNPDGTQKWRANLLIGAATFRSGFAIDADGTLYIGGSGYFTGLSPRAGLVAINPDGTLKWKHEMPGTSWTFSSPAIGADGSIYLGVETSNADTDNNYVYAINRDGTLKWRYVVDRGRTVRSSPAIGSDGTIYIGTKAGPVVNAVFLALNPDGTLKWSFPILENGGVDTGDVYCSPAIGANGIIYFGAETGYLYAMNPDGTLAWKYSVINGINWTSPAIASDGTIYIGNNDGKLFAIISNSLGLADTPWPKVHHDNKNTGRSN